jgi:hypothetical protein
MSEKEASAMEEIEDRVSPAGGLLPEPEGSGVWTGEWGCAERVPEQARQEPDAVEWRFPQTHPCQPGKLGSVVDHGENTNGRPPRSDRLLSHATDTANAGSGVTGSTASGTQILLIL